jgi:wyosine [tRNA(Phe)-imidazoG37] synthetase (radical SAM superfamily)
VHQQSQKPKTSLYTYGPVPSRRLGFSLGIDIMPYKNCSFDCIYCQLGKTTKNTVLRKEYRPTHEVLREIKDVLKKNVQIDFLTFSGSGEPTLHKDIGYLIDELKKLTKIPIAVLTNGSLLYISEVRNDLKNADLVIPTLCTTDDTVFRKIHRGHYTIGLARVIEGYIEFRKMYKGQIWLEVMLVHGINDRPEQIIDLKKVIDKINPDKIHLNTVVRPPSEACVQPVPMETLQQLKEILGEKCEIIVDFGVRAKDRRDGKTLERIAAIISRRPITVDDLAQTTGLHKNEILKYIHLLSQSGKVKISRHDGKEFYTTRGNDDRTQRNEQR